MKAFSNRYLIAFLLFVVVNLIVAIFSKLISFGIEEIHIIKAFQHIVAIIFVLICSSLFRTPFLNKLRTSFNIKDCLLILEILSLFAANNFFLVHFAYAENAEYIQKIKDSFYLFLQGISISSIYEELLYRGLIQPYINQKYTKKYGVFTAGNLFCTFLMFLTCWILYYLEPTICNDRISLGPYFFAISRIPSRQIQQYLVSYIDTPCLQLHTYCHPSILLKNDA